MIDSWCVKITMTKKNGHLSVLKSQDNICWLLFFNHQSRIESDVIYCRSFEQEFIPEERTLFKKKCICTIKLQLALKIHTTTLNKKQNAKHERGKKTWKKKLSSRRNNMNFFVFCSDWKGRGLEKWSKNKRCNILLIPFCIESISYAGTHSIWK